MALRIPGQAVEHPLSKSHTSEHGGSTKETLLPMTGATNGANTGHARVRPRDVTSPLGHHFLKAEVTAAPPSQGRCGRQDMDQVSRLV